jgi:hypothetical protein
MSARKVITRFNAPLQGVWGRWDETFETHITDVARTKQYLVLRELHMTHQNPLAHVRSVSVWVGPYRRDEGTLGGGDWNVKWEI